MISWIKNLFKKKKKEDPIPNSCLTTGRVIFKIPVGNLSREEAERQLKKLISNYQTNYWFPSLIMTRTEKIKKILNKIQPKEEN
jgi:hypothetical protein